MKHADAQGKKERLHGSHALHEVCYGAGLDRAQSPYGGDAQREKARYFIGDFALVPVLCRSQDLPDEPEDRKERQQVNQQIHGVKIDEVAVPQRVIERQRDYRQKPRPAELCLRERKNARYRDGIQIEGFFIYE